MISRMQSLINSADVLREKVKSEFAISNKMIRFTIAQATHKLQKNKKPGKENSQEFTNRATVTLSRKATKSKKKNKVRKSNLISMMRKLKKLQEQIIDKKAQPVEIAADLQKAKEPIEVQSPPKVEESKKIEF